MNTSMSLNYRNPLIEPISDFIDFSVKKLIFSEIEIPLQWKDTISFIRVIEGEGTFVISGRKYRVRAGSFLIINPNKIYSATSEIGRPLVYEALEFMYDFFVSFYDNNLNETFIQPFIEGSIYLPTTVVNTFPIYSSFISIFDQLSTLYRKENSNRNLMIHSLMFNLLYIIMDSKFIYHTKEHTTQKSEDIVKGAINHIHDAYENDIDLDMLSHSLNTSKPHLCRTFKRISGQTITEYLNNHRIIIACDKLINTDYSVSRIAFETGYRNIPYFHKRFKLRTELTPKEYRDIYKKG